MSRPREKLTPRQRQRRDDILSTARRLISECGFDGVRMRELAAESGVTPKTLYHQFESKENLLRHAVEERFRTIYQTIDAARIDRGIDRLFFIIDAVAESFRENEAYARALAPMLSSTQHESEFAVIRAAVYRRALTQIAEEGDLTGAVSIEALNQAVIRHVSALYQAWRQREIADIDGWKETARMEVSLLLAGVSRGATRATVLETLEQAAERQDR